MPGRPGRYLNTPGHLVDDRRSLGDRVFELDGGGDVVLFALQQPQRVCDRGVTLTPGDIGPVDFSILQMQVRDARVIFADELGGGEAVAGREVADVDVRPVPGRVEERLLPRSGAAKSLDAGDIRMVVERHQHLVLVREPGETLDLAERWFAGEPASPHRLGDLEAVVHFGVAHLGGPQLRELHQRDVHAGVGEHGAQRLDPRHRQREPPLAQLGPRRLESGDLLRRRRRRPSAAGRGRPARGARRSAVRTRRRRILDRAAEGAARRHGADAGELAAAGRIARRAEVGLEERLLELELTEPEVRHRLGDVLGVVADLAEAVRDRADLDAADAGVGLGAEAARGRPGRVSEPRQTRRGGQRQGAELPSGVGHNPLACS